MPAVRSLLARVARLEQARAPAESPFERAYGSLEAFAAGVQTDVVAGVLDPRDGPDLLAAVQGWHQDAVWEVWH
jgi:hypothetical protein